MASLGILLTGLSLPTAVNREDDAQWPKKNIVGKQELEIRIGNEHIAFEVSVIIWTCLKTCSLTTPKPCTDRQNRIAR